MAKKKHIWFQKVRGSYLPCSWQGWLLYIPYVTFLVGAFVLAYHDHHTSSGLFFTVFPQYVAALVVMHWVASRFSK